MVRTIRTFEDPDLTAARQTNSLAALAISLALVVASLYLIDTLRTLAAQQDCAMSGKPGCLAMAGLEPAR